MNNIKTNTRKVSRSVVEPLQSRLFIHSRPIEFDKQTFRWYRERQIIQLYYRRKVPKVPTGKAGKVWESIAAQLLPRPVLWTLANNFATFPKSDTSQFVFVPAPVPLETSVFMFARKLNRNVRKINNFPSHKQQIISNCLQVEKKIRCKIYARVN